jgi:hypothetical protein
MASGNMGRRTSAPVKYDNTGKPTKQGVKSDNTGKPIKPGAKSDNTGKPINSKSTPTTSSSTAQVPKGGAKLPTTGDSAKASLAKSLIKKGVGRLVPGVGLILTAAEVVKHLNSGETAANKPVANYGGQMRLNRRKEESESSQERAKRITRKEPFDIKELDTELRMKEDLKNPREVLTAPGSDLKDKGGAYSKFQNKEAASRLVEKVVGSDSSRPLPVDTQSKKPLVKRIMEALGDNRSMKDATRDRKMTEEMERERMGQKKGGMGQKKKDSVKKAYGGMVKKKQGGSANKVNMKAGFTRRGCSKG